RARERARGEPGLLALDVEVADLAEVEKLLVELRPRVHAAHVDVVREVVDLQQARALRILRHTRRRDEVHVADREVTSISRISVDEIDEAAADALYRRDVELHRSHFAGVWLGAKLQRTLVRLRSVLHAHGKRARARPVHARKRLREAVRFAIDD